jgi:hypothetical protein
MNHRVHLAWALVALLGLAVSPPAGAVGEQTLNLAVGLTSVYDDNILQYSQTQLDAFESGLQPTHFSIRTAGDGVYSPYVVLGWEWDRGSGVRLKWSGNFHQRDDMADNRSLSTAWHESFGRPGRLTLGYYALQDYYLRQLFDPDASVGSTQYRRAEFDLRIGAALWLLPVSEHTRVEFGYQYENRQYSQDFIERDSALHLGKVTLGWRRLPRHGALDLVAGYRASNARAEDGDETPGSVPDEPDLSYHGIVTSTGGALEFLHAHRWRLGADLQYGLETRSYDSDRPFDTYHYKRNDMLNVVEVGLRAAYRPHWSARGFYRLEDNSAKLGPGAAAGTEVGSYREDMAGLAVEWSGTVWRQERGTPSTDVEQ